MVFLKHFLDRVSPHNQQVRVSFRDCVELARDFLQRLEVPKMRRRHHAPKRDLPTAHDELNRPRHDEEYFTGELELFVDYLILVDTNGGKQAADIRDELLRLLREEQTSVYASIMDTGGD
jgi:hypothetical protein